MAVINTTNVVDSSMFLKARLKKNMVGDNYYIENLQDKRNQDWAYRYNVVDIEEEKNRQIVYTNKLPEYKPLEVVIRSVKNDKGQDLGTDWASVSFKDLKYPNPVGARYRFSYDFPKMAEMTEEEKYYGTSVWIAINENPLRAGNQSIIRRCNANIALVGSPTRKQEDMTEHRYEPVVLENELKYMNMYFNQTLVVPQAEWYITMQMNYFSNCIKVNNRLIFGGTCAKDVENNSVYKVKAVIKCTATSTFMRPGSDGIEEIPLVVIAVDKDTTSAEDNLVDRIAVNAPVYYVPSDFVSEPETPVEGAPIEPQEDCYIQIAEGIGTKIMLGNSVNFDCALMVNGTKVDVDFEYEVTLNGIKQENWHNYYEFGKVGLNSFSIKNLKACNRGTLDVKISCKKPSNPEVTLEKTVSFKLGGFY